MTTYQLSLILASVLIMLIPFGAGLPVIGILCRGFLKLARLMVRSAFGIAALSGLLIALTQMSIIVTRNLFQLSFIKLEEIPFYLFGAMFLLAGGAILLMEGHVRVDVFYSKLSARVQRMIDLIGLYVFTAPFGALVMISAGPFVARATSDGAINPGGIPAVFLLKGLIPVFGLMILLAAAVRVRDLMTGTRPHDGVQI